MALVSKGYKDPRINRSWHYFCLLAVAVVSFFMGNNVLYFQYNADSKERTPQSFERQMKGKQQGPGTSSIEHYHLRSIPVTVSTGKKESPGVPSRLLVGLMVTDREDYYEALQAQSDTWLQEIPPERAFVVGPIDFKNAERRKTLPRFVPSPCVDRELWCKRLEHVIEAARLLEKGVEFDWLWSGNEDWYVDVEALQNVFEHVMLGPDHAVVYSSLGCARYWEFHPNSNGNTFPKPAGWPEAPQCQTLKEKGGICGGPGIVFSRKAVEIMMRDGANALYERTLEQPFAWNSHPQDDTVLSCVIYSFQGDINLEEMPWISTSDIAQLSRVANSLSIQKDCPRCHVATFHAVKQANMSAAELILKAHDRLKDNISNGSV